MSYSVTVREPSPQLVMLQALANRLLQHAHTTWHTIKSTLLRGTRLLRASATTALAVIGSHAGYQLARHTARNVITGTVRLIAVVAGVGHRALTAVGRAVLAGIDLISPTAADVTAELFAVVIAEPLRNLFGRVGRWINDAGQLVWKLSDMRLVRTVTTRAAQLASIVIGVHAITKGAAAAAIVQAAPWAMDAVLVITNPAWALAGVTAAFIAAVVFAATRLATTPDDPDTNNPGVRPATVTPLTPNGASDLGRVATNLNVEVTGDGSVVVHGIPDSLPEEVGLQVAHIAADAATTRLEQILLRRPVLNRDDRRLLTKVAREAVRVQRRLVAS